MNGCVHAEVKLGSMIMFGVLESDVVCKLCGRRRSVPERDPAFSTIPYASVAEKESLKKNFGVTP